MGIRYSWSEYNDCYVPLSNYDRFLIRVAELPYDVMRGIRRVCRKLFWPKCDLCGQPAYFEHYPKTGGWIYVCWECSFIFEGHGCVE